MYKYIALTALALGSAALGFNINRGDGEQITLALIEGHPQRDDSTAYSVLLDINQDGLNDVVKAFLEEQTIQLKVRFNEGNETLSPWTVIGEYEIGDINGCNLKFAEMRTGPLAIDLNGDFYLDLILSINLFDKWCTGAEAADFYFINNGSGGFACAGDVTGDGTTNVDDLLGVIGDWGCTDQGLPD